MTTTENDVVRDADPRDPRPPALAPGEFLRWAWRQLTSMRVALILLFLLAVAAIPGSVIPQSDIDPVGVTEFRERNPTLGDWYDRLGLFDVFGSPWFAAIYLALLVSLVGCILPRAWQHGKALRAQPPPAPRRLSRLPGYESLSVDAAPGDVLSAARDELRRRRYRVVTRGSSVDAEAGYLRETGNLAFHLALVVVLLAVAVGSLFGYRGTVLLTEDQGFSNQPIQYDTLESGAFFEPSDLPPFSLGIESFTMDFIDAGAQMGTPDGFEATVAFTPSPGAESETRTIRVNEPLEVGGSLVHILNPGYAPAFTVRAADGRTVLAEGPVPFLPQDDNFTSTGVIKVQAPPDSGEDLGIEALLLPTAALDASTGPVSIFPEPRNPYVFLTAYHGDLGLDDGVPQSVYRLDKDAMEQFADDSGQPFRASLAVGDTVELPDGAGYITFDGYVTWVNLQVSRNSGKEIALVGAVVAVLGLLGSLYVRRRRAWVRASADEQGRTVVEVAGLHRNEGGDVVADVREIAAGLRARLGVDDAARPPDETKGT